MSSRSLDRSGRPAGIASRPTLVLAAAAAAGLAFAGPAAAQEGGGEEDASRQEVMRELQQLNQRLNGIRQEALQDSAIRSERDRLESLIRERMRGLGDATAGNVARMGSLQDSLASARQEGDSARARELTTELRRLQQSLQSAQQEVMQQPEVAARVDSFRTHLIEEMREVDPETRQLMERADSLLSRLQGGGG